MSYAEGALCFQLVDVKKETTGSSLTNCCPDSAKKCLIVSPCGPKSDNQTVTSCCPDQAGKCVTVKKCQSDGEIKDSSSCKVQVDSCGQSGNNCVCIKLCEPTEETCIMVRPGDFGQSAICICVC